MTLQHVARRGLVFERLLEIVGALAQFVEQPRVLDRDDRLVGEGAHQLDLPLGERLDMVAGQAEGAGYLRAAQQRHADDAADLVGCGDFAPPVGWVCRYIRKMHDPTFQHRPSRHGIATRDQRPLPQNIRQFVADAVNRGIAKHVAVLDGNPAAVAVAQPRGGLQQRVEHRMQVEGRAADDLQHVARRGLVFERFLQIAGALVQLGEQPNRFDRDHRLIGKGLQQLDLRIRKRLDMRSRDGNGPQRDAVAQHRDRQRRTKRTQPGDVFRISPGIRDVHDGATVDRAGGGARPARRQRENFPDRLAFRFGHRTRAKHRTVVDQRAIKTEDRSVVRLAQDRRAGRDRLEGGLHIRRRTRYDAQNFRRRGLLFERLARLGQQPRVLHRDDRLRREILQQRDLLVGKRPHLAGGRSTKAPSKRVVLAQRARR